MTLHPNQHKVWENRGQELTSWKEIADFLKVTVRTAQKWEKERGLPVRRLPGGRGRVSVRVGELEVWKDSGNREIDSESSRLRTGSPANSLETDGMVEEAGASSLVPVPPAHAHPQSYHWPFKLLTTVLIAAFGLGLLAAFAISRFPQHGPPAVWKVINNTLIVSDDNGAEVFKKTFDKELDVRRYPQLNPPNMTNGWFGDLEGDGTVETLFAAEYTAHYAESSVLICFAEDGTEKWRFVPGKTVSTAALSFEPIFVTYSFKVARLGRGRGKTVIVNSSHRARFPVQVALLTDRGKLTREYWHSGTIGHPMALEFADFDENGVSELYLGGVNNWQQATLVVLDPDTMEGASLEKDPTYQLRGFPPGKEIARILFPRTCINRKLEGYNWVSHLLINKDSLTVDVWEAEHHPNKPNVVYDLWANLTVKNFVFLEVFLGLHSQMSADKQLDHTLSSQEEEQQRKIEILRPVAIGERALSMRN